MSENTTTIKEIIQRTPTVKSFRLKREIGMNFTAGQYLFVTLDYGGKEQTKPLSLSSSPSETEYIEFTKRITDSEFSKTLNSFKPGDSLKLRLPYGQFTLEESGTKIAFLAGGIGITPFMSMSKYAASSGPDKNIILLYGNKSDKDIIFKSELDRLKDRTDNFNVIYTINEPHQCETPWEGCSGFIDHCMIRDKMPDFEERVFYVCGPPQMVSCLLAILKDDLKIPEEKIKTERFAGY